MIYKKISESLSKIYTIFKLYKNSIFANLILFILSISFYKIYFSNKLIEIYWNQLQKMILENSVDKITVIDKYTTEVYSNNTIYMIVTPYIDYIEKKVNHLQLLNNNSYNIDLFYTNNYSILYSIYSRLSYIMYIVFMILVIRALIKVKSGLFIDNENPEKNSINNTKLEDIGGLFNSKKELIELIEIFSNYKKYEKLGGRIPKGALLEGPPGTGKTMLARAIANHYNLHFILCSGSDLIKPIVGTGSIQVKEFFSEARKNAPSILFIDEIDAIGKKRDNSSLNSIQERENILNSLLIELDGFESNNNVFVLAATNIADTLDKALTRPGRFDRCIKFQLPCIEEREDILKIYMSKMPINDNINKPQLLSELSFQTYGFSGADLQNVCNESAIFAGKKEKELIDEEDFTEAIDYINLGSELVSKISSSEKKIISVHESGHVLTTLLLNTTNKPFFVSIVSRSKGALGFTKIIPEYEKKLHTYEDYFNELCILLGGRIAEKIIFKSETNGAYDDLQKINKIANDMITKFGMGKDKYLNNIVINNNENDFYKRYSEDLTIKYEASIIELIKDAEQHTHTLLSKYINKLELLSSNLEKREILYLEDIKKIINI